MVDFIKIHNAIDLVIQHYKAELVNIVKLPFHLSRAIFKLRRYPFDRTDTETAVLGFLRTEETVFTRPLRFITFFTPPNFSINEILQTKDLILRNAALTRCVLVYEDTAIFNFKRII